MSTVTNIEITPDSPYSFGVPKLIEELDNFQRSLYPPESTCLLSMEGLARPEVTFFVARRVGLAVGIGALLETDDGYGEVKRMYVSPEERGRNLGRTIMERIEDEARSKDIPTLMLETGIRQPAAIALYKSCGFSERGPFGEYPDDPLFFFMEKSLQ